MSACIRSAWTCRGRTCARITKVIGARTRAIGLLALGRPMVIVASARALLRKVAPASGNVFSPLVITREDGVVDAATGEPIAYEDVAAQLVSRGYERLGGA